MLYNQAVFRILDANCNRLREALRVIEEYFRFIQNLEEPSVVLKTMRHKLITIESDLGSGRLLDARDTATDCFSEGNRPEELHRDGIGSILAANFKRAQEAARVIEEYAKLTDAQASSSVAKEIRFSLYSLEHRYAGREQHGET